MVEDASGSKLIVSWHTSAEIDTLGFHVLRSSDGTLVNATQVTEQLIPSQGSDGGSYSIVLSHDGSAHSALSFWLYEVETDGTINYYGPATAESNAAQLNDRMFLPFLSQ